MPSDSTCQVFSTVSHTLLSLTCVSSTSLNREYNVVGSSSSAFTGTTYLATYFKYFITIIQSIHVHITYRILLVLGKLLHLKVYKSANTHTHSATLSSPRYGEGQHRLLQTLTISALLSNHFLTPIYSPCPEACLSPHLHPHHYNFPVRLFVNASLLPNPQVNL